MVKLHWKIFFQKPDLTSDTRMMNAFKNYANFDDWYLHLFRLVYYTKTLFLVYFLSGWLSVETCSFGAVRMLVLSARPIDSGIRTTG